MGAGMPCYIQITGKYHTNGTATGTHIKGYLATEYNDSSYSPPALRDSTTNAGTNITLVITDDIQLSTATSFDDDGDGYLNGYDLRF